MKTIPIDNLNSIESAFKNRNLEALRELAVPTLRTINKSSDFSSVLMLSCNNIKHLSKIETLEAECIILNLEDGVAQEDKPFALLLCAIFLSRNIHSSKKLVVRVNALDEGGYEEIRYLNRFMPDAVRVPKIKNRDEVASVLEHLSLSLIHISEPTRRS